MAEKVDFDLYAGDYNKLLRENTAFFSSTDEYFARYKVTVARGLFADAPRRVLEYGCGIGRNIPYLCEAFPESEVIGSDISNESLDVARAENPGIEFFWDDGSAGQDVGQFDLIFVAGVFHHIPPDERNKVVASLRERLAIGGSVLIFEHNPLNPVTRRIVNNCPYDADAVLLHRGELKGLMAAAGLSVQRSAYCLFVPPKFSRLLFLENWFGRIPFGGQYWVHSVRSV